jgi:hypothetical protein
MARKSKRDKRAQLGGLAEAVRKLFGHVESMQVAGVRMTPDAIVARLQLLLDDYARTYDAYHAWLAALAMERRHEDAASAFLRAIRELVGIALGLQSGEAKRLGVSRRKTGPKTAAAKVEGARKAAATRAERGTSSRRRRRR